MARAARAFARHMRSEGVVIDSSMSDVNADTVELVKEVNAAPAAQHPQRVHVNEPAPTPGASAAWREHARLTDGKQLAIDHPNLIQRVGETMLESDVEAWGLLNGLARCYRFNGTDGKVEYRTVCVACGLNLPSVKSTARVFRHLAGIERTEDAKERLQTIGRNAEEQPDGKATSKSIHSFFSSSIAKSSRCAFVASAAGKAKVVAMLMSNVEEMMSAQKQQAQPVVSSGAKTPAAAVAAMFDPVRMDNAELHAAILEFLALHDLPPHVIDGNGPGSAWRMCMAMANIRPDKRCTTFDRRMFTAKNGQLPPVIQKRLEKAQESFAADVRECAKSRTGGTLAIDGMTKVGRKTNNAVLVHEGKTLFVSGTNVNDERQDLEWHEKDVERAIQAVQEVGDVITFVVTDGEGTTLNAAKNVVNAKVDEWTLHGEVVAEGTPGATRRSVFKYKKMFHQRCSTHGYDLLLPDVTVADDLFAEVAQRANAVVIFVKNHSACRRAFKHASGEVRKLHKPVETRFLTNWMCVKSVFEARTELAAATSAIGSSPASENPAKIRSQAKAFASWLLDDVVMGAFEFFLAVLSPIAYALRETDTQDATMYKIADVFERARAASLNAVVTFGESWRADHAESVLHDQKRFDDFVSFTQNILRRKFAGRENDCVSTWARAARALFAPSNYICEQESGPTSESQRDDLRKRDELRIDAITKVLERIYDDDETRNLAFQEYTQFYARADAIAKAGIFAHLSIDVAFRDRSLAEHRAYWMSSPYKFLSDIAIRLCHGVTGQGAAERQNKVTARVYTPVRNRQLPIMTDAFVRIRDDVIRRLDEFKRKRRGQKIVRRNVRSAGGTPAEVQVVANDADDEGETDDDANSDGDGDVDEQPVALPRPPRDPAEIVESTYMGTIFTHLGMKKPRNPVSVAAIARAVDLATSEALPSSSRQAPTLVDECDDEPNAGLARRLFMEEIRSDMALDLAPADDGEEVAPHAPSCDTPAIAIASESVSVSDGAEETANASGSPQVETRAMSPVACIAPNASAVATAAKSRSGVRKDARRSDGKRKAAKGKRAPGHKKRRVEESHTECAACQFAKHGQKCTNCRRTAATSS